MKGEWIYSRIEQINRIRFSLTVKHFELHPLHEGCFIYNVCLLIYVFPFMQCMSQFSRFPQNVIFFTRNKILKKRVQFISQTQIHSMNFHVGQEWFMWSGAILSQQFNSPGIMKRPDGNVSIPSTFHQGVCVCVEFSPLKNVSLSVTWRWLHQLILLELYCWDNTLS